MGRLFFGEEFSKFELDGKPLTTGISELVIEAGNLRREPLVALFGMRFAKMGLIKRHREINAKKIRCRELCKKIVEERRKNPAKEKNLFKILLDF